MGESVSFLVQREAIALRFSITSVRIFPYESLRYWGGKGMLPISIGLFLIAAVTIKLEGALI